MSIRLELPFAPRDLPNGGLHLLAAAVRRGDALNRQVIDDLATLPAPAPQLSRALGASTELSLRLTAGLRRRLFDATAHPAPAAEPAVAPEVPAPSAAPAAATAAPAKTSVRRAKATKPAATRTASAKATAAATATPPATVRPAQAKGRAASEKASTTAKAAPKAARRARAAG